MLISSAHHYYFSFGFSIHSFRGCSISPPSKHAPVRTSKKHKKPKVKPPRAASPWLLGASPTCFRLRVHAAVTGVNFPYHKDFFSNLKGTKWALSLNCHRVLLLYLSFKGACLDFDKAFRNLQGSTYIAFFSPLGSPAISLPIAQHSWA